jgi:hypothetical protein
MEKMTRVSGGVPRPPPGRYDFTRWSFEELREFAERMRVPDARSKSRRQLVELFNGPAGHHR